MNDLHQAQALWVEFLGLAANGRCPANGRHSLGRDALSPGAYRVRSPTSILRCRRHYPKEQRPAYARCRCGCQAGAPLRHRPNSVLTGAPGAVRLARHGQSILEIFHADRAATPSVTDPSPTAHDRAAKPCFDGVAGVKFVANPFIRFGMSMMVSSSSLRMMMRVGNISKGFVGRMVPPNATTLAERWPVVASTITSAKLAPNHGRLWDAARRHASAAADMVRGVIAARRCRKGLSRMRLGGSREDRCERPHRPSG